MAAFYIFAIFFWADSSVVSFTRSWNPFSVLHIPLYGILVVLLVLASPSRAKSSLSRYMRPALIALAIGIADEIHQAFLPAREASLPDVFLDGIGIFIFLYLYSRFPPFFLRAEKKLRP